MSQFEEFLIPVKDLKVASKSIIRVNRSKQALFIKSSVDGQYSWKPFIHASVAEVDCSFTSTTLREVVEDAQKTLQEHMGEEDIKQSNFTNLEIISRNFRITNINPVYLMIEPYLGDIVGVNNTWRYSHFMSKDFSSKKQVLEYLHQYITNNLYELYNEGYLNPQEIKKQSDTEKIKHLWWCLFVKPELDLKEILK